VADQLAIAVGAQWEAEACIHHLNDPCLLPVSWAAADVSLADPWDQLEMLPDTGVAQLASPSPGTWATSPDDLASPPSDTWGFKSLRSARDFAREEWPLRGSAADVLT
jgi:hypothetical protein